jgi:hypothetical protein
LKEAKGCDRVKLMLQKEIESMRRTFDTISVSGHGNNDVSENGDDFSERGTGLGVFADAGKPFKFEDIASITFANGSATDTSAARGLLAVSDFLRAC